LLDAELSCVAEETQALGQSSSLGESATAVVSPLRNASHDLTRGDADAHIAASSAARGAPVSSKVAAAAVATAREGLQGLSASVSNELLLFEDASEDGGAGREQSKNMSLAEVANVRSRRKSSSNGVNCEIKTTMSSQLRRRVASGFSIAAVCTGELLCPCLCITEHPFFVNPSFHHLLLSVDHE